LRVLPPAPTLFPYTTLFRSHAVADVAEVGRGRERLGYDATGERLATAAPLGGDPAGGERLVGAHGERRRLPVPHDLDARARHERDRKSTRLNSSHVKISYAV